MLSGYQAASSPSQPALSQWAHGGKNGVYAWVQKHGLLSKADVATTTSEYLTC